MPNIRMLSARRELYEKEKLKQQGVVKARRNQENDNQDVHKKTNTSESARTAKKAERDAKLASAEEKIANEKRQTAAIGAVIGGIGAISIAVVSYLKARYGDTTKEERKAERAEKKAERAERRAEKKAERAEKKAERKERRDDKKDVKDNKDDKKDVKDNKDDKKDVKDNKDDKKDVKDNKDDKKDVKDNKDDKKDVKDNKDDKKDVKDNKDDKKDVKDNKDDKKDVKDNKDDKKDVKDNKDDKKDVKDDKDDKKDVKDDKDDKKDVKDDKDDKKDVKDDKDDKKAKVDKKDGKTSGEYADLIKKILQFGANIEVKSNVKVMGDGLGDALNAMGTVAGAVAGEVANAIAATANAQLFVASGGKKGDASQWADMMKQSHGKEFQQDVKNKLKEKGLGGGGNVSEDKKEDPADKAIKDATKNKNDIEGDLSDLENKDLLAQASELSKKNPSELKDNEKADVDKLKKMGVIKEDGTLDEGALKGAIDENTKTLLSKGLIDEKGKVIPEKKAELEKKLTEVKNTLSNLEAYKKSKTGGEKDDKDVTEAPEEEDFLGVINAKAKEMGRINNKIENGQELTDKEKDFVASVQDNGFSLAKIGGAIVGGIGAAVVIAAKETGENIAKGVVNAVEDAIDTVKDGVDAVKNLPSNVVNSVISAKDAIVETANDIKDEAVKIGKGIAEVADNVVEGVKALPENIKAAGESIVKAGEAVIDFGKALPENVADGVKAAGNALVDAGKSIGNGLESAGESIVKAGEAVIDFGKALPENVADGVKAAGNALVDAGKSIGNGVVEGVKDAGNALVKAGESIVDGVKNLPGNIADGAKAVGNAFVKAGENIASGAKELANNVVESGKTVLKGAGVTATVLGGAVVMPLAAVADPVGFGSGIGAAIKSATGNNSDPSIDKTISSVSENKSNLEGNLKDIKTNELLNKAEKTPSELTNDEKNQLKDMKIMKEDGSIDQDKLKESKESNIKTLQDKGIADENGNVKVGAKINLETEIKSATSTIETLSNAKNPEAKNSKDVKDSKESGGGDKPSKKSGGLSFFEKLFLKLSGLEAKDLKDTSKKDEVKAMKKYMKENGIDEKSDEGKALLASVNGDAAKEANKKKFEELGKKLGLTPEQMNKYFKMDDKTGNVSLKNGLLGGDSNLANDIRDGKFGKGSEGGKKVANLLNNMEKNELGGLAGNVLGDMKDRGFGKKILGLDKESKQEVSIGDILDAKEEPKSLKDVIGSDAGNDNKIDQNDLDALRKLKDSDPSKYDQVLKDLGLNPEDVKSGDLGKLNASLKGPENIISGDELGNMLTNSGVNLGTATGIVNSSGLNQGDKDNLNNKIGGAKNTKEGKGERASVFNSIILGINASMPAIQFMLQQLDKMREAQDQLNEARKKKEAALKLLGDIAKELKRTQGAINDGASAGKI